MGAILVRVRQDDDLVVFQAGDVEILADAGAEGRDDGAELLVLEHLFEALLLHVQRLAAQGQNGLKAPVPALLGRPAGGVALHDEQLVDGVVPSGAATELSDQGRVLQLVLLPGVLLGFPGRGPGLAGLDGLVGDDVPRGGVLDVLQVLAELRGDHRLHGGPGLGVAQLRLGLALELDVPHLHGQDHGEPLPEVLARQGGVLVLQDPRPAAVVVHAFREGRFEAGLVGAALGGGDVVHVGEQVLVVAVVVLDGEIHQDVPALAADVDGRIVEGRALAVEISHEVGQAPLEAELVPPILLPGPIIGQRQLHAPVEVGKLPQPPHDHVVAPFDGLEHPIVG